MKAINNQWQLSSAICLLIITLLTFSPLNRSSQSLFHRPGISQCPLYISAGTVWFPYMCLCMGMWRYCRVPSVLFFSPYLHISCLNLHILYRISCQWKTKTQWGIHVSHTHKPSKYNIARKFFGQNNNNIIIIIIILIQNYLSADHIIVIVICRADYTDSCTNIELLSIYINVSQ